MKAAVAAIAGHAVRVGGAAVAVVAVVVARVREVTAWGPQHFLAVGISMWFSSVPVVGRWVGTKAKLQHGWNELVFLGGVWSFVPLGLGGFWA